MSVAAVTPGSGLALEGSKMTLTRVATKLQPGEIMATSTLKRWDTSWSNRFGRTQNKPSKGLKMKKLLILVKKRLKCESRIRDLYERGEIKSCIEKARKCLSLICFSLFSLCITLSKQASSQVRKTCLHKFLLDWEQSLIIIVIIFGVTKDREEW